MSGSARRFAPMTTIFLENGTVVIGKPLPSSHPVERLDEAVLLVPPNVVVNAGGSGLS